MILDKETHQVYTNAWRARFAYGSDYNNITYGSIVDFCKSDYNGVRDGNLIEFLSLWFN